MPEGTRFLLGYGERLTSRVPPPLGGRPTETPYDLETSLGRLGSKVRSAASALESLPDLACPHDEAVGVVTMHPQAIAKSYYPRRLLNEYGLRQVGSRPTVVTPDAWTKKEEPVSSHTTDLYVAGDRASFAEWAADLETGAAGMSAVREDIQRLEDVRAPAAEERIRLPRNEISADERITLEVVLHAHDTTADEYIIGAFARYAASLGVEALTRRRLFAGGLCFMPVQLVASSLDDLAKFAFLRMARPVPRLRGITPIERATPQPTLPAAPLPFDEPLDKDLRIAIFDGGIDASSQLTRWTTLHDPPGIGPPAPELLEHGHNVTSAALFGSVVPGDPSPQPYAYVDHYRVLDANSNGDPLELYDVLSRVQTVLQNHRYEFFNLSLGPVCPVEDDEVHPWTAVLDEYLADGLAVGTLAVGNTGLSPDPVESRIQVPADCVNALAIGASNSVRAGWSRADYSSVGPGRSPGVVKPDAVDFGGEAREPFMVYDPTHAPRVAWTQGTSFAAPSTLRRAAGIRAHFGDRLSPLAIKALLVHTAGCDGQPRAEVGWGRIQEEIADIVVCPDGAVRVVYQGELTPSHYLRALIPLPDSPLHGRVTIKATLTYATATDPEDPGNYTRSGLDVTFRPHSQRFAEESSVDPKSASFFKRGAFDPEHQLRSDALKWETVLQREQGFMATSLHQPVFDIHYNARAGGAPTKSAERIRYALIVDVASRNTTDLYDQVVQAYIGRLEALRPRIDVPVRLAP